MPVKILAFSGSLRRGSYNTTLAHLIARSAKDAGAEVTTIELREFPMPLFDEDLEKASGMPEHAKRFKDLMIAHHGFIIACPEYNSSITAALKNAIDWATRPAPGEPPLVAFSGKVAALGAASPGNLGGLRGLVTVRAILGNIGVVVLPQQVAVMKAHEAFTAEGTLKDATQQQAAAQLGSRVVEVARRLHT